MTNHNKGKDFVTEVVLAIQEVVGCEPVPLHEPEFKGNEWRYVKECLDSNFVSSIGKYVDQFERNLEAYTGAKHAIAVTNGTAALHISLILAGVRPNDEVIVPALTFVATANAVIYCGGIPLFADSEEETLGIDPVKLREYLTNSTQQIAGECINKLTGRVIRAAVPMHVFGHPCKIKEILEVCDEFKIRTVEDAAESLGSRYLDKHTGTLGLLGTLSFNGNKIITTGGGGAILTNDSSLAKRAKHITTTAKLKHPWLYRHDEIGFNYRLPNLNAALGCSQLEYIEDKISRKRNIYKLYVESFEHIDGVSVLREPVGTRSNYWLQTIVLDHRNSYARDLILEASNKQGISTRPAWDPINSLTPFSKFPSMNIQVASSLATRIINIPSSPGISTHEHH
jgi:aminotransferase in exopolysaccharide biosynthesis